MTFETHSNKLDNKIKLCQSNNVSVWIGFSSEFFTAMVMRCSVLCYVTRYSPLTVNRRLLLDTCFVPVYSLVYSLILNMEANCSSETSDDFNGLYGVILQKIEIFIS
jgi:hypothetical protein